MSSGTPYIGSKISLVSKAEIRYEGFLYTIDQNDSTVTLAKVISLGTEDRVPDSPVPAREEVFEYIVFRGSDIKDLHVCEGPKRVEDPAIVHQSSHSYSQNYNPNYHHRSPFAGGIPNFGGYNPFGFHPNGPGDVGSSRQHTPPNLPRTDSRGSQPKNQMGSYQESGRSKVRGNESRYKDDNDRYQRDNRDSASGKSSKENRNASDQYDESREGRNNKEARDKNKDNRVGRGNRIENDRRGQRSSSNETKENTERIDSRDRKENTGDGRDNRDRRNNREREYKENRYVKDNRNYRDNNNRYRQNRREYQEGEDQQRSISDGSRGQSRGGRGGRGYSGRGGGNRRGGAARGGNSRTKFTEDFDFETANAKFNKEEIEKELLKVLKKVKIKDDEGSSELKDECDERESDERAPLPSPDKFYDRSKSFFDNILCEAMVPKTDDEVMTRRQEQALNAETFGTSASHFRPGYRGRGRGRGRWRGQGRGGFYRGRGNYRGNSNRRWVDYEFDYEAAGIKNRHQPMKVSGGGMD